MSVPLCTCNRQFSFLHSKTLVCPPLFQIPSCHYPIVKFKDLRRRASVSAAAVEADSQTLPQSAIQRIAEKLRSLGYVEESSNDASEETLTPGPNSPGEIFVPLPSRLPKYRVGHTLDPSWSTPENPVPEPGSGDAIQRFHELRRGVLEEKEKERVRKRSEGKRESAPSLAELTLPKEELTRLRSIGIGLKKKIKVGKAGITEGIVNGIHERWRRSELVKITCEDICRMNMKRTHELLERKTGGLVVWRSGSNIILYRGSDYKYPYFLTGELSNESPSKESPDIDKDQRILSVTALQSPAASTMESPGLKPDTHMSHPPLVQGVGLPDRVRFQLPGEAQLAEEADTLLEGLGPRFNDWWGYDPLPVDADLLPAVVPGYKRPFRLLPYGVKPKLTNDEMTTLRRLGRPLPSHFALGRNRKLQGLAASIVKLWEKCEIAKIAVKRGVQNTNSDLMAEELKRLTGGTLLSRDKEFIVFYRGKDFLPSAVSLAIEERRKCGVDVSKTRTGNLISLNAKEQKHATTEYAAEAQYDEENSKKLQGHSKKGKLRFSGVAMDRTHTRLSLNAKEQKYATKEYTAEAEHDEEKSQKLQGHSEERELRFSVAAMERTNTKLSLALAKKDRAEKLLAKLQKEETPQPLEIDKEGITEEERYMLRKVGLRMKPFLLMGRRGVFDGTIENMHLHWKYRELVKVCIGRKSTEEVHEIARTLEAESGGILVAVEPVTKGYAIIVYRGKNYKRPASLRPRTLLSKREAMKRSIEAQRRESLKLHILKLSRNIDGMKLKMVQDEDRNDMQLKNNSRLEFVEQEINENHDNEDKISHKDPEIDCQSYIGDPANEASESHIIDGSYEDPEEPMQTSKGALQIVQQDLTGDAASAVKSNYLFDTTAAEIQPGSLPKETKGFLNLNEQSGNVELLHHLRSQDRTRSSTTAFIQPRTEGRNSSFDGHKNEELEPFIQKTMNKKSPVMPVRASPLSNRERLFLRKQALRVKKMPVLAVGKSNVVTGIAKAIKAHFLKHPLAIVNIKGRAKGTSAQEVIYNLEQATGAILVSQEPSKVILYRGSGSGSGSGAEPEGARGELKARPSISPELLSAIRLECGLNPVNEEHIIASKATTGGSMDGIPNDN